LITILLVRSSASKVRRSGTKGAAGERPNRKYTDLAVPLLAREPRAHDGNVKEKGIRKACVAHEFSSTTYAPHVCTYMNTRAHEESLCSFLLKEL
jgi:hypothetical protein